VYEAGSYPFGYIGPIFVIWQAMATASHSTESTEVPSIASKPTGKRKRKQPKKSNSENSFLEFSRLL
jgi:hypothetical protein